MVTFDLTFLGTGAADFSLAQLEACKSRFDKNTRRTSCAIFNGKYMIDCGTFALDSLQIANVALADITDLFVTHTHSDHFVPKNVETIAKAKDAPLRIWVREDATLPEIENTQVFRMKDRAVYEVNGELRVTGLASNHGEECAPQFLLFEKEAKKFLYATDGAWFLNTTYYYLHKANLDLLVLDCTSGDYEGEWRMAEHNDIRMIRCMLPCLKTWEMINENTQVYLTHLARTLHRSHEETAEIVKPLGAQVAYDGLRIEV
ncbi:MAG: MBL fold metallo-hydrolase [Clostridia bacterium]|nr:MBL fold metallo-hydrolase [Clostridia bacterium]